MKSDTCWYKNWWKTRNNGTGNCILYLFTEVPSQNLKYNVKQACIFNLIMVGIPSSLILYVMKRRGGGRGGRGCRVFVINEQSLLSMMKVICWGSLSGWLLSLEFKVYLKKFIPSPEMQKFHVIPGYNLSWYTEQPRLVLFHVISY